MCLDRRADNKLAGKGRIWVFIKEEKTWTGICRIHTGMLPKKGNSKKPLSCPWQMGSNKNLLDFFLAFLKEIKSKNHSCNSEITFRYISLCTKTIKKADLRWPRKQKKKTYNIVEFLGDAADFFALAISKDGKCKEIQYIWKREPSSTIRRRNLYVDSDVIVSASVTEHIEGLSQFIRCLHIIASTTCVEGVGRTVAKSSRVGRNFEKP